MARSRGDGTCARSGWCSQSHPRATARPSSRLRWPTFASIIVVLAFTARSGRHLVASSSGGGPPSAARPLRPAEVEESATSGAPWTRSDDAEFQPADSELREDRLAAADLRRSLARHSTEALGARGQALAAAALSALVLFTGVWLTAGAPRLIRHVSWFAIGSSLGLCWALHPRTCPGCFGKFSPVESVHFTVAIAVHIGVLFSLFQKAGRYLLGALGAAGAAHCLGGVHIARCALQAGHELSNVLVLSATGLIGAHLTQRFEKSGLCVLSAFAGGFGLAVVLHWWGRWVWLLLRNIDDPAEYNTPAGHLGRLLESSPSARGMAEYSMFLAFWLNLGILGCASQWSLFTWLWESGEADSTATSEETRREAQQKDSGSATPRTSCRTLAIALTPDDGSIYLPAPRSSASSGHVLWPCSGTRQQTP
ncbi:unnamed protein product [Polarella glacialis]|uniref:Uncharacterized protein n=1 Tax=Polarella glacialis TaxID=89957 RepID=A0A813D6H4_POLGL|nr:unnamed protein product [Polarella glacialis]